MRARPGIGIHLLNPKVFLLTLLLGASGIYAWGAKMLSAGQFQECERGNTRTACATASQITTMVLRFNKFLPVGATAITLTDGATYTKDDLAQLVTAGYCARDDLETTWGGGWVWRDATHRFEPAPLPPAGRE